MQTTRNKRTILRLHRRLHRRIRITLCIEPELAVVRRHDKRSQRRARCGYDTKRTTHQRPSTVLRQTNNECVAVQVWFLYRRTRSVVMRRTSAAVRRDYRRYEQHNRAVIQCRLVLCARFFVVCNVSGLYYYRPFGRVRSPRSTRIYRPNFISIQVRSHEQRRH